MVVSTQRLAVGGGREVLRQGGNAIDAAVAVGYAEAVVNPCCGNIGGGGFMTAHLSDGRDIFINFREIAPAAASRDMYLDAAGQLVGGASLHGWKAVAVPGTVMGLDTALAKYGTMPRADGHGAGHPPGPRRVCTHPSGRRHPGQGSAAAAPRCGRGASCSCVRTASPTRSRRPLSQPELAATLQSVAGSGTRRLLQGTHSEAVEAASRAGGGIITAADFAAYRVDEAAPLSCTYRGYVILSAPPPSSGGTTICEILNILEGYRSARAWASTRRSRSTS